MGRPVFLVDNLFNPRIYSSHSLSASSTAAGTHVLSLSAGRRVSAPNVGGWFASALNADAWVQATFNRRRAFDVLFIDRQHNLSGHTVSVRISDDGFSTFTELGPKTIPSTPTPNAALYDGEIVRTDEGALLWWLDAQEGYEARVFFPAMGAGLRPELAGLMLGQSFAPGHAQVKPMDFGNPNLLRTVTRTAQAQSTSAEIGRFRSGRIRLRAETWFEYAFARYHFEELYAGGRGMVLAHNDESVERALFAMHPGGPSGFVVPDGKYLPEIDIPFEETEPVLL